MKPIILSLFRKAGTWFIICLSSISVLAQDSPSFEEQTKLIRIKKIASEWQGSTLTLHTREGEMFQGRLVKVAAGHYYLESRGRELEVPLQNVTHVSFEPGTPELLLSFASAIMGGAFLTGALLIANDNANQSDVSLAALLGLLGGGLWGYSTFYETEIIELE